MDLLLLWGASILAAIHVLRTGRPLYWLFFLALAPIVGPLFYLATEVRARGGSRALKVRPVRGRRPLYRPSARRLHRSIFPAKSFKRIGRP